MLTLALIFLLIYFRIHLPESFPFYRYTKLPCLELLFFNYHVLSCSSFIIKMFTHILCLITFTFYNLKTWTILIIKLKHLHIVAKLDSARELVPKCHDSIKSSQKFDPVFPFPLGSTSGSWFTYWSKAKQNFSDFDFEMRCPIALGNFLILVFLPPLIFFFCQFLSFSATFPLLGRLFVFDLSRFTLMGKRPWGLPGPYFQSYIIFIWNTHLP